MLFLMKEMTAAELWGDIGLTVLVGMVVVFAVLILLTVTFKVFGLIMSRGKETVGETVTPVAAPAAAVPAVVGNTAPVTTVPTVQNGIPEETVAVISAAVASMAPAGKQYAVASITKK